MKYEFNTIRFAELMTDRGLSPKDVATLLEMTNKGTIREWRNGGLIGTKRLIDICNAFDINPTEFFLCDEKILPVPVQKTIIESNENDSLQIQIAFLQEKLEFEKEKLMFEKEKNEYLLKQLQKGRDEIRNS